MSQGGLIKILEEMKNIKNKKDIIIKEENELNQEINNFSNSFNKLYEEFSNYISPIINYAINDEIGKNINKYKTNIINEIENFKKVKITKIFELSQFFDENINVKTFTELIDDTLEIKINTNENENENESYSKPISKSTDYDNFYADLNKSENSKTMLSEKQKKDSEIDISISSNNTINDILKCYGCENEGTIQCINKECCNFIFCKNCSEIGYKNDVKINHNLKIFDKEEYKDIERKKEKYLDLISEICTSFFIKINYLFEKGEFPSFPDIKDINWEKIYLDNIEQLYNKLKTNNNDSFNLKEPKICKRCVKKFLDKINFKLPIPIYFVDVEKIYNEYLRNTDFIRTEDEFAFNEKNQTPNEEKNYTRETENFYNYYCKDNTKETIGKEKEKKKEGIDTVVDEKQKTGKINTNTPIKSISEVAEEVIRGEWGIGLIRRNKLKSAGYDFNQIQDEVDRILFSKK
jgi:hypothetical protein